ncbi:helix-turn-helix domain-containing protein [Bifidobacterium sp. ESL0682]|uniref:PucR family transcriptional regulator n=1 Tax=Bifidobacterium sp. ESL0682 TaxID=2983212 RepID=UPI0023F946F7|nr:helix-turn-helix domain-containing protein [Bifidobacterium sp. ESL0682]WEV41746.1 helix-turn-helix domain-containing protein [Bifidobacterium sp. ESL0682]
MSTHDTDKRDGKPAEQADFLNLVEGKADIATTPTTNNEKSVQEKPSQITVIADSHDPKTDEERIKAAETLGNRDNLEAIAFECLAHGLSDRRVTSLLHVLGWPEQFSCFAIGGTAAATFDRSAAIIRRKAHDLGSEHCLVGRSNGLTVGIVVVQSAATPEVTCTAAMPAFDPAKPVCLGPTRRNVDGATRTLSATLSAFHVMPAIHPLPRPARAADMLPERALVGDTDAIDELYQNVYQSLKSENENDPTLQTVATFLTSGGSLDTTGKELNVHPNTVRYRIKRAADATGWDANDPRDAYVLHTAIIIGTIRDAQNGQAQR